MAFSTAVTTMSRCSRTIDHVVVPVLIADSSVRGEEQIERIAGDYKEHATAIEPKIPSKIHGPRGSLTLNIPPSTIIAITGKLTMSWPRRMATEVLIWILPTQR